MNSTKEKLILCGMDEVRTYGLGGFSLRRVAAACGVSCAAPYKHFSDKQELFSAMIEYVNAKWVEQLRSDGIAGGRVEERIARVCAGYVRFLCENPHFRSILIIKETGLDTPGTQRAASISIPLKRLFVIYGRKAKLSHEELRERIFIVRSLVYGAAIMVGVNGAVPEQRLACLSKSVLTALE
ncbi:MAG: TetR/AcrR family transcriptional regulator [Clostridia bacterium]|nr:TetR/AcrR family transcriptional regulator [Clostridia bacterium]MBQ2518373.1 TetR/AcrR family transcriptional regulator [Clostridia bacterium]